MYYNVLRISSAIAMYDVDICSWHCVDTGKPNTRSQQFGDGIYTHSRSQHYQPVFNDNIIQETLWSHSVIHQTATNEKLTMKFKSWNLTLEILQDFTLVCSFFTSYYNKIKLRDLTMENADSATRNRNISITGYCSLVWHQRSRFQHGTRGTPTTHVKWW